MLTEEQLTLAIFAQIAYDYYSIRACNCSQQTSVRIQQALKNAKERHPDNKYIQSFEYLTHQIGTAFKSDLHKHIVIAYTGTDFALPVTDNCSRVFGQLIDDLSIFFFDKPTDLTLSRARKFANRIISQNSGYNYTITGHSLGGNIAERTAYNLKLPCVTFNAFGTAYVYLTKPRDPHTLSIRTTEDGLNLRKLDELADNTILYKDLGHSCSAFTGVTEYYSDMKNQNSACFGINGFLAFLAFLMISPFLIIFGLIFSLCYVTCVRPKRKREARFRFITSENVKNPRSIVYKV